MFKHSFNWLLTCSAIVQQWDIGGVEKVGNFFCLTPPLSFLLTDGRLLITNNFSLPSLLLP